MANSTFTPVEYSKHIWQDGEVITKEKLQNIEDAIFLGCGEFSS